MALVVKNLPENAGDMRWGFDPWIGKIPWGAHGNLLQYSSLENPMDREAWQATVHRLAKSQIWLKQLSMYARTIGRSVMWGYKKSAVQNRAFIWPCWHPDFGLPTSRTISNKGILGITYSVCVLCHSSLNGLRHVWIFLCSDFLLSIMSRMFPRP